MKPELEPLKQLVVECDGRVSGKFFHGVGWSEGTYWVLWNLRMGHGRYVSTEAAGRFDSSLSGTHRSINDIPIDQLRPSESFREENFSGHVFAPRFAHYVFPVGIHHRLGSPGEEAPNSWRRRVETSDRELAFEIARRQIAPRSPSRLSCVFLAHGTDAGRGVINGVLRRPEIFDVRIDCCLAATVADSTWYDLYLNAPKNEYLENYWKCLAHPEDSKPEILLDGVLQFTNKDQLAKFGIELLSTNAHEN